jgi:uncharacterized protein (TIGR02284 family)
MDKLNDLIRLDLDAMGAYEAAIASCEQAAIKSSLQAFRRDHLRHVRDLSDAVVKMGGEPARHRDLRGILMLGFTKLASRGDQSALLAMRGTEELTNRVYASALDGELESDARKIVERNYQDEQRHLSWIKDAVAKRIWEERPRQETRATGTEGATTQSTSNGKRRGGSRRAAPAPRRRSRRARA